MNKFLKFGLTAMVLMFVFNVVAVRETKAQQVLNEILKRMDDHNKALQSLQANVKMDKYNPQLDVHDISEGTTKYVPLKGRDALVRIDWDKPRAESLAIVNKQYVLYTPALKQAIIGKVDSSKSKSKGANSALAFINMSKTQLKANYTTQYVGIEKVDGIETWHILLTPRTAQNYKTADLWVDGNGMPIQAKVTELNNDSTTVYLSNLRKNEKLNTSIFKIDIPKDVKKITG